MKYKVAGFVAFVAVFIIAVIVSIWLSDENANLSRYHEHLEKNPYVPCTEHADDRFCTHLPIISIDTRGQMIPGKGILYPVTGDIIAHEKTPDGKDEIVAGITTVAYDGVNHHKDDKPDIESDAVIHIRGRSSRRFDKSGYSIKFIKNEVEENPVEFLGMAKHDEWALHGPYLDKSLIRNYMWYNIGGEIMEYTPNCRFCEVFINGEYKGLYLAVEKITAGENGARLNIKTNSKDNSFSGYIIKYDSESETPLKNLNTLTNRINALENTISVVYPKGKNLNDNLAEEINLDFSAFEKALYSYDYDDDKLGYKAYIDVNSFVDFFIVNEVTSNYDAGNRSTFFYKDLGGKFKTCIWDFDACNDNYTLKTPTEGFHLVTRPWFSRLTLDEDFNEAVIKRYWDLRETYLSNEYLNNYIDNIIKYLGSAIDRNFEVWGYTFEKDFHMLWDMERNITSYEEAISQFKGALFDRIKWLDENIETIRRYSAESATKNFNENPQ